MADYSNGPGGSRRALIWPRTRRYNHGVPATQDLPVLQFPDQVAWERWLQENQSGIPGVWMKFAKKGAPVRTVNYAQALDVALCYGWIDGQLARLDEHFYLQRFTPRTAWSQVNVRRATDLISQGRMQPAGVAPIDAARADGRWQAAYPPASEARVPEDLQRALDEHPEARRFFETLTGSRRYAFLYRLHEVKRAETRARRIASYIELLSEGRTLG